MEDILNDAHSVLSDKAIEAHMKNGTIIIEPFNIHHLSTTSYDVTLGENYYREVDSRSGRLFNMYSKADVARVWGEPMKAVTHNEWAELGGNSLLENIGPNEQIIFLRPGETILGHTNEFIGGTTCVTTMMKARSSLGRCFIEVCKCAGWGDIGYVNRWTMEITNNSRFYIVPLVVGRRVAQIVFFKTLEINGTSYGEKGKYQPNTSLEITKAQWSPESMLPKCYLDYEGWKIFPQPHLW